MTSRRRFPVAIVAGVATVLLIGGVPLAAPLLRGVEPTDLAVAAPTGTSSAADQGADDAGGASTGTSTTAAPSTAGTTAPTTTRAPKTTKAPKATTPAKKTKASAPKTTKPKATKAKTTTKASAGSTSTSSAKEVLRLTNVERKAAGCPALAWNSKLAAAAQAHSTDMAQNDYFDHNSQDGRDPFERIKAAGYSFRAAAENIAAGQPTPAAVVDGWMNSEGHRANILNCELEDLGVGVAKGGSYGVYWTQDFGTAA